ncbi:MAG: hypothetical protein HY290_07170, partial [Planctomycetia bacterium]|nr:hypothetical protein [Planctomycetia bacterium]
MLSALRIFRLLILVIVFLRLISPPAPARADDKDPVRVLVWDEQQPAQKQVYENFLGNQIAGYLAKQPGLTVKSNR